MLCLCVFVCLYVCACVWMCLDMYIYMCVWERKRDAVGQLLLCPPFPPLGPLHQKLTQIKKNPPTVSQLEFFFQRKPKGPTQLTTTKCQTLGDCLTLNSCYWSSVAPTLLFILFTIIYCLLLLFIMYDLQSETLARGTTFTSLACIVLLGAMLT